MRLMKPENIDNLDLSKPNGLDDYHIGYQVKVITPIYGGGVKAGEPDTDMPIRASAIKGQLRYWWRFLQSNHIEDKNKQLKGTDLFIKERDIWGGMGDESEKEKGKDFSSKVFLQIHTENSLEVKECSPSKYNQLNQNNRSALHYALFPVIQNSHDLLDCEELTFTLKVRASKEEIIEAQWKTIQEAIQWWACFGGLGARTRRGLGAVEINQLALIAEEEVKNYGCTLKILPPNPDATTAWNKSIDKLQTFRQGKNIGRNKGSDPKKPKKLGRSFWPEADTIRKITNKNANGKHPVEHGAVESFPRAAFGLPIIFDFNAPPSVGEPNTTELKPKNSERMASPLILKPMAVGDNKYAPIALLLPTEHLQTLELELLDGKRELKKLSANTWWPNNQDKQKNLAKEIPPMRSRGNTALEAFMNYFGGK